MGAAKDSQSLGTWMARYLEWMRVANYSPATVADREVLLGRFLAWCAERGAEHPEEVTKALLERYQRFIYHRRREDGGPLAFGTQRNRLVAVRTFFGWLAKRDVLAANPASELELPRSESRLPKHVLSPAEAERVLAQPDVATPLGLRDRALLETLYSTGMRRMELIALRLYDLDAERGVVRIRQGKGKKDRTVPIGERAVAWTERYLAEARPRLAREPDDGTLFLTNAGTPLSAHRLTQLLGQVVAAAGIAKRGACHLFRHTMATAMLDGGADIRFIQQMLGHANLATTQVYTQVSIQKLKAVHTATHPSARLVRDGSAPNANSSSAVEG